MKKYEIIRTDYIEYEDRKLYRIRALKNFWYVSKGELGGYIESEYNLSQENNCWIADNARAFENAIIKNNAQICDDVIVQGNVIIRDNSFISGSTHIKDYVIIKGDSQIYGNGIIEGESILLDAIIRN